MEDKGQINQMIVVVVMAVLLVGIMVFFFVYTLIAPLVVNPSIELIDMTSTAINDIGDQNLTNSYNEGSSFVKPTLGIFNYLGYLTLFGLFIAFLILAYNARTYPYLAIVWIVIIVIVGLTSFLISNSYEDLKNGDAYLKSVYEGYTMNDIILTYFPHIIISFGFVSGILLFGLIATKPEEDLYYG